MNIDKKLTEILTSTLVIENKKGIPFAVAKIKELIVMNQSNEETAKDLSVCKHTVRALCRLGISIPSADNRC